MRIAVWNMSHWEKSDSDRADAWAWLRKSGVDVALVQEAVPPSDMGSVVYQPIGGRRPWGSAIVGLTAEVIGVTQATGRHNSAPVDLLVTHPGAVAVATVALGDERLTLISMYGVIDDGYADTTINRMLSDLVPLFDDPVLGRHVVLGGDLNITTQWVGTKVRYREWERATFARIEALGLRDCLDLHRPEGPLEGCNCLDGADCRHIRTQYHQRSARPWQNDYVYATAPLVASGRVGRAEVVDDPDVRALSGHLPIILDLD